MSITIKDVDLDNKVIVINKSYQRISRKDVITEPKTKKGIRRISIPEFLIKELLEYESKLYGIMPADRLFLTITKSYLEHEMVRGCEISGVKKIRLHDIRHSHATLLISKLGLQVKQVADRLGHEKIQTTLDTYAHLFPDQSWKVAEQLDALKKDDEEESYG